MKKYKICPSCNAKNDPTLLECLLCEADLTRVRIIDDETERMLTEDISPQRAEAIEFVRVCECGEKNPPNARKCRACAEDISDITPTSDKNDAQESCTFILSSLDGKFAYKMSLDEVTIGRENVMSEYLINKNYVSRAHAKLSLINNELFIENLSTTNFTYVNNQRITSKMSLSDGDEIGLGGTNLNGKSQLEAAYFGVRICKCM